MSDNPKRHVQVYQHGEFIGYARHDDALACHGRAIDAGTITLKELTWTNGEDNV